MKTCDLLEEPCSNAFSYFWKFVLLVEICVTMVQKSSVFSGDGLFEHTAWGSFISSTISKGNINCFWKQPLLLIPLTRIHITGLCLVSFLLLCFTSLSGHFEVSLYLAHVFLKLFLSLAYSLILLILNLPFLAHTEAASSPPSYPFRDKINLIICLTYTNAES